MVKEHAGQIRRIRWTARMQMSGQVECKRVVKWSAISHELMAWRLRLSLIPYLMCLGQ